MTEYTPGGLTWEDIRRAWAASEFADSVGPGDWVYEHADFDSLESWLAEHDRQVAERAWDEGRMTMARDTGKTNSGTYTATPNPYRKEATGE